MNTQILETKLQTIFENSNIRVETNYKNEPLIYYDDIENINLLSFEVDKNNNIKVKDYHLKFYINRDTPRYLNLMKKIIDIAIFWKKEYIQKQVIEVVKDYMGLK